MADQPGAASATTANKEPDAAILAGSWFGHIMAAVDRAAASTYHRAIAIEADVTKWENDNPQLGALAMEALGYVESFATRFGVPVSAIAAVGNDIMTAWKSLAALDPSVPTPAPGAPA